VKPTSEWKATHSCSHGARFFWIETRPTFMRRP
jgi:hypothetical protein